MKIRECMLLLSLGLIIWILGTIYYAKVGHRVLETTPAQYWVSFAISPIISAAFCIFILRWRHIAPSDDSTQSLASSSLCAPTNAGRKAFAWCPSKNVMTSAFRSEEKTPPAIL